MKIKDIYKFISCFYLAIILFFVNKFILSPYGIYGLYSWADILMHFLGGISIAYGFILVLRKFKDKVIINNRFFEILIIVALVGLTAILWEFYEITLGLKLNINDTLIDLFMGLLGGLSISTIIKIK